MNDKIYEKEIKVAAAAIEEWSRRKMGFIPCGKNFYPFISKYIKDYK